MLRILFATALSAGAAFCQAAAPPTFDVASIKVSPPGRNKGNPFLGDNIRATPGSLTMTHVSLKASIAWAYNVFEYQVKGPGSIDSENYEIVGKAGGPAGEPELRIMLQNLLADRFQLKLHRETKEMQAYVVTVGKNGPKFHASEGDGETAVQPDEKSMSVHVRKLPMSRLIDPLARLFQTPVIDMTGLTGRYDATLSLGKYMMQGGERPDPVQLVQMGMQEELGLKLESKKMPVDLLVVDSAAKVPTEN